MPSTVEAELLLIFLAVIGVSVELRKACGFLQTVIEELGRIRVELQNRP